MLFLNKTEVRPGAIIKVAYDENLHGYAKLVEPSGKLSTFLSPNGISDEVIFTRQRWLLEWIDCEEIPTKTWERGLLEWVGFYPNDLPPPLQEEKWNQRFLSGNRTHRSIICKTGMTWDDFVEQNGYETEIKYGERGDDNALKDSNLLF